MKKIGVIILFASYYIIVTPGFHCGETPLDCRTYRTDTATLPLSVTNPSTVYHINDTIRFFSNISDTIHSVTGNSFITELNTLSANILPYKVNSTGAGAQLNYATNEFNAFVETGSFQNTGIAGFEILYNRSQPLNTLKAALVPGDTGLYLITINISMYSPGFDFDIYNPSDRCTNYKGIVDVPSFQQQRQYWDSLGTTSLTLANGSYNYISKNNRNYFFIKVIP